MPQHGHHDADGAHSPTCCRGCSSRGRHHSSLSTSDSVDARVFATALDASSFWIQSTSVNPFHFTPLTYVSKLFDFWRGDIKIRLKFICTHFHKARVRVSWDPIGDIYTSSPNYAQTFNEIIDIGCDNDVEFTIPYMQAQGWLKTRKSSVCAWQATTHDEIFDNGLFTVRVVNVLSSPQATDSIKCMVFVRAGDNFEFAVPSKYEAGTTNTFSPYTIQAVDGVCYMGPKQMILGGSANKVNPQRHLSNFGEAVVSLRQLIHRPQFNFLLQKTGTSSDSYDSITIPTNRNLTQRIRCSYIIMINNGSTSTNEHMLDP